MLGHGLSYSESSLTWLRAEGCGGRSVQATKHKNELQLGFLQAVSQKPCFKCITYSEPEASEAWANGIPLLLLMPPEVRLRFPNFLIMIIFTFFIDPFNYPDKTANSSRNSNGDPDQIFRYVHFNLSRRDANFGRACLLSLKTVTEVQLVDSPKLRSL